MVQAKLRPLQIISVMFKIAVFRERGSWAQEWKRRTSEEFVSNQLGRDDAEAGTIKSRTWVL